PPAGAMPASPNCCCPVQPARERQCRVRRAPRLTAVYTLVRPSLAKTLLAFALMACEEGAGNEPRSPQTKPVVPSTSARKPSEKFEATKVQVTNSAMGTNVTMIAYTNPSLSESRIRQATSSAMAEIRRLEALMSSWQSDSDVSRINAAPGKFVHVSPETLEVIQKGLWAGEISAGTFDITFQTLSGLWKFGDAQDTQPAPPNAQEVARLKPEVDFRKIKVRESERQVRIGARQRLGLGGIAKGYIVDKAAQVLRQAKVN